VAFVLALNPIAVIAGTSAAVSLNAKSNNAGSEPKPKPISRLQRICVFGQLVFTLSFTGLSTSRAFSSPPPTKFLQGPSFPLYPQISCLDQGVLFTVVDDGKYPCLNGVDLSTGKTTAFYCPSVNPDGALWYIGGELLAVDSMPTGPGYDPRVHR
jgi:hypothetical protein